MTFRTFTTDRRSGALNQAPGSWRFHGSTRAHPHLAAPPLCTTFVDNVSFRSGVFPTRRIWPKGSTPYCAQSCHATRWGPSFSGLTDSLGV